MNVSPRVLGNRKPTQFIPDLTLQEILALPIFCVNNSQGNSAYILLAACDQFRVKLKRKNKPLIIAELAGQMKKCWRRQAKSSFEHKP